MILVDRAKPETLEEMILSQRVKDVIRVMLNDPANKLTGMTLAGLPGTGKSTLVKFMISFLNTSNILNYFLLKTPMEILLGLKK